MEKKTPPIYLRPFRVAYSFIFYLCAYLLINNRIRIFYDFDTFFDVAIFGQGFLFGVLFADLLALIEDYVFHKEFKRGMQTGFAVDRWALMGLFLIFGIYVDFSVYFTLDFKKTYDGFKSAILIHFILYNFLIRLFPLLDRDFQQSIKREGGDTKSPLEIFGPILIVLGSLIITATVLFYFQDVALHDSSMLMLISILSFLLSCLTLSVLIHYIMRPRNRADPTKITFYFREHRAT